MSRHFEHEQPGYARLDGPDSARCRHGAQKSVAQRGNQDKRERHVEIERLHDEVEPPDLQYPSYKAEQEGDPQFSKTAEAPSWKSAVGSL